MDKKYGYKPFWAVSYIQCAACVQLHSSHTVHFYHAPKTRDPYKGLRGVSSPFFSYFAFLPRIFFQYL